MAFPSTILSLAHAAGTNFLNVLFGGLVKHTDGLNLIIDDLIAVENKLGLNISVPTTAGDVLYVTSGQCASWGPRAPVRLAEVTLAATAATIDFTNIPQTFRGLEVHLSSRSDAGTVNVLLRLSSDGTTFDSGANYDWQQMNGIAAVAGAAESFGATSVFLGQQGGAANVMTAAKILLPDYTQASFHKPLLAESSMKSGTSTGNLSRYSVSGFWRQTAAIKGLRLLPSANNFNIGTRVSLYGWPAI